MEKANVSIMPFLPADKQLEAGSLKLTSNELEGLSLAFSVRHICDCVLGVAWRRKVACREVNWWEELKTRQSNEVVGDCSAMTEMERSLRTTQVQTRTTQASTT